MTTETITTYIAGVRFRPGAAQRLRDIKAGTTLGLQREPGNKHDAFAVKVVSNGQHLGYVPRDYSMKVARAIDFGARVSCRTKGGWQQIAISIDDSNLAAK